MNVNNSYWDKCAGQWSIAESPQDLAEYWEQVLTDENLGPIYTFGGFLYESGIVSVVPLEPSTDLADHRIPEVADAIADDMFAEEVWWWLNWVSEHERNVLTLRHGFDGNGPHTQREVSSILGIGVNAVGSAEKRAYSVLRRANTDSNDAMRNLIIDTF